MVYVDVKLCYRRILFYTVGGSVDIAQLQLTQLLATIEIDNLLVCHW
jgi:hypothetical protein